MPSSFLKWLYQYFDSKFEKKKREMDDSRCTSLGSNTWMGSYPVKIHDWHLLALWKAWWSIHRPFKAGPGQRDPSVSQNWKILNLPFMWWPGTQMEAVNLSSKVCGADLFIQAEIARGVSWWAPVATISDLLIQVVVGGLKKPWQDQRTEPLLAPQEPDSAESVCFLVLEVWPIRKTRSRSWRTAHWSFPSVPAHPQQIMQGLLEAYPK